jgi:uncharacterized protein with PIN domain
MVGQKGSKMAWPNEFLKQKARDISADKYGPNPKLERDNAKMDAARTAHERAEAFPTNGASLCPKCWMNDNEAEVMQIGGSLAENNEVYRCPKCHSEFSFSE